MACVDRGEFVMALSEAFIEAKKGEHEMTDIAKLDAKVNYILDRLQPEKLKDTLLQILDDIEQDYLAVENMRGAQALEEVSSPEGRLKAQRRRELFKLFRQTREGKV